MKPIPQPNCDDLIRVANHFREIMGLELIDLERKLNPETGEPVTLVSFVDSLEAWEQTVPGAKERIREMAVEEARLRNLKSDLEIRRGRS